LGCDFEKLECFKVVSVMLLGYKRNGRKATRKRFIYLNIEAKVDRKAVMTLEDFSYSSH